MKIGAIRNYYGCLEIKEDNGKWYWGIEDYANTYWEEIPRELYLTLEKYQLERLENKQ